MYNCACQYVDKPVTCVKKCIDAFVLLSCITPSHFKHCFVPIHARRDAISHVCMAEAAVLNLYVLQSRAQG